MAEEFYESDVIFSDEYDSSSSSGGSSSGGSSSEFISMAEASSHRKKNHHRGHKKQRKTKQKTGSVPIRIPDNIFVSSSSSSSDDFEDEGYVETEEVMMPPHLIVAKRLAERMGAGYGRALKGRELNQVRNSILRMTGFLET